MVVHLPDDKYPYNVLGLDRIKRITEKAEQLGVNMAATFIKKKAYDDEVEEE